MVDPYEDLMVYFLEAGKDSAWLFLVPLVLTLLDVSGRSTPSSGALQETAACRFGLDCRKGPSDSRAVVGTAEIPVAETAPIRINVVTDFKAEWDICVLPLPGMAATASAGSGDFGRAHFLGFARLRCADLPPR